VANFDFQKLGNDRFSQNIKRSINNPVGSIVTGDITKGEVVALEFTNESTASATVTSRRTGAIPINTALDNMCEFHWTLTGTTLSATLNVSRTGTLEFWVF
jgi:hypothetical protein